MMKKVMHGELSSASEAKRPNDKLEIDANKKVNQGDMASGTDAKGKSKSGVDASIFIMAEERDY